MTTELLPVGAPELGMSRGEMLEHIDFLWNYVQSQEEFTVQIVFAWLVAMIFVAQRLSRSQFIAAHVFYVLILVRQYMKISDSSVALNRWYDRAAFPDVSLANEGASVEALYFQYASTFIEQALIWLVLAGSIWWSISCRRSGETLLGGKQSE